MRYKVIAVDDHGGRRLHKTESVAEAIAIGMRLEADGLTVFVSYPDDPAENTLAWFKASMGTNDNG